MSLAGEFLGHFPRKRDLLDAALRVVGSVRKALRDSMGALQVRLASASAVRKDADIDVAMLALRPGARIITSASTASAVLSYLTADPASIVAVDSDRATVALTRLKLAAVQQLPSYDSFLGFCGKARGRANMRAYRRFLRFSLDPDTRRYWDRRSLSGRRRAAMFRHGLERHGRPGYFTAAARLLVRVAGTDKGMSRPASKAPLPAYLQPQNYQEIRARAGRARVRHGTLLPVLLEHPAKSLDTYVLLDAQEWMIDEHRAALWHEITRTARPGARVVLRTPAEPGIGNEQTGTDIAGRWSYDAGRSTTLSLGRDASGSGVVHLYEFLG